VRAGFGQDYVGFCAMHIVCLYMRQHYSVRKRCGHGQGVFTAIKQVFHPLDQLVTDQLYEKMSAGTPVALNQYLHDVTSATRRSALR